MARPGRKPKSAELKLVTGNPGKRALPKNEPEFDKGELVAPEWIDEREESWRSAFLEEWERVTAQAEAWGVVGAVNQGLIEGICLLYATAVAAAKANRSVEMRQSFEAYRKALNECGLTPASKGRIGAGVKAPRGKLAKYTR